MPKKALALSTMWLMGGMGYPFLSDATKHLAPMNLVLVRTLGTTVILALIFAATELSSLREIKWNRDLAITIVCAFLFYPICSGSLAIASSQIPGALTALLFSTLPVISTLYALYRGDRPEFRVIWGLSLSLIAVGLLIGVPDERIKLIGVLAGIISVLTWFIATEIWIKYLPKYSIMLATTLQALFGAIGTLAIRPFFTSEALTWSSVTNSSVIFLIFSLATQHFAYLWLTTRVSGVVLMLFSIINPLIAGITGYLLFGQSITIIQCGAGLALLIGVYQIIRSEPVKV